MKCAGVKVRGYWRGYSCGAVAKYKLRGKHYCGSHLAIARDEPHLFKEAIKAEERAALRRHRQEKARLAAEAEKEKQLDAFDKEPSEDEDHCEHDIAPRSACRECNGD